MKGNRTICACVVLGAFAAARAESTTIAVPGDYPTIALAIAAATPGDVIVVDSVVFSYEPSIDYLGKAIRVESTENLSQPQGGLYRLAADSTLASGLDRDMYLDGALRSGTAGIATVHARNFFLDWDAWIDVLPDARLDVFAPSAIDLHGQITVEAGGTLSLAQLYYSYEIQSDGGVLLLNGSELSLQSHFANYNNGVITGIDAAVTATGALRNFGTWTMDGGSIVANDGIQVDSSQATMLLIGTDVTLGGVCWNHGLLRIYDGTVLGQTLENQADLELFNTTVYGISLDNAPFSTLSGYGFWAFDFENAGYCSIVDDTTIVGDVLNELDATIVVHDGTLTILGTLTNDGTIIGDVNSWLRDTHQIRVDGDFIAESGAGLLIPTPLIEVSVSGSFVAAIDDHQRFDLAQTTLHITAGMDSPFEVMSTDVGPYEIGLDRTLPGHFPIGTLHLAAGVTNMFDAFDNDLLGQTNAEALYVDTLRIDSGATLNTNGNRVYYRTLVNDGSVDDPANLVEIGSYTIGDVDHDGDVDLADLAALIASYDLCVGDPEYNADADFDVSGCVDISDLAALLSNYGLTP